MLPPALTWPVWVWVAMIVVLLAAGVVIRTYIEERAPLEVVIVLNFVMLLGAFAFGIEVSTGEILATLVPIVIAVVLLGLIILATLWEGALAVVAIVSGGLSRAAAIIRRISLAVTRPVRRRQASPARLDEEQPTPTRPPDSS